MRGGATGDDPYYQIGRRIIGSQWQNVGTYMIDEEIGVENLDCHILCQGGATSGRRTVEEIQFRWQLHDLPPGSTLRDSQTGPWHKLECVDNEQSALIRRPATILEGRPALQETRQLKRIMLDPDGELPDLTAAVSWPAIIHMDAACRNGSNFAYIHSVLVCGVVI